MLTPMFAVPRLLAVATAVPPFLLDQSDVVERVKLLFGRSPDLDRLLPVFLNTGILRRYSCVPIEWYDRAHGWPERNSIYLASALDLLRGGNRAGAPANRSRKKRHRQHCRRFDHGHRHPEP